ncbi:hypothetical protein SO802_024805, partial [Lithocarpus litseifolius]
MHQTNCSTRASNELGGGNPQATKMTFKIVMVLVVAEMVIIGMILFFCRYVLGFSFSSEKEVWIMICLSIIMDGSLTVLLGNFLTFLACNGHLLGAKLLKLQLINS